MTSQIVNFVMKEAASREAKKVVEVRLQIGSLAFLNPEQVSFWYKMLVKDTILDGSKLVIEEKKEKVHCKACGYEGGLNNVDDPALHVPLPTLQCPNCASPVRIVEGRDCVIRNIKMLV